MSKLVICEKPSVAKSIASALGVTSRADGYFEGGGWLISWCIGHLVGLADAATYDDRYKKWRYEDLPILPNPFRYVVSEKKAAQFHVLQSLMERPDVTELVNACDAGREGELIFRLVYEAAGCSKPFSRLWISSLEDAAIREGFADLRPGADYDPLYQSALCRQKADWLIGINASRLFSVLYHRTLNMGGCRRLPWRCWPTGTARSSCSARRNTIMCGWRWKEPRRSATALFPRRTPRLSGTPAMVKSNLCIPGAGEKDGEAAQAVRPDHLAAGGKPGVRLHGQANSGLRPVAL